MHYSITLSIYTPQIKQLFALRENDWILLFLSSQVLLRFPWCLLMVQCLQSMCLLDMFHRYSFYTISSAMLLTGSLSNSIQLWYLHSRVLVCFLVDHRRERSAAGSGFTSATRVPPRGPLPSPPPSTSTPCSPACLHPTPCHDAPATPPVHRHSRGCGRHELSVYLPVPSNSYLLRAGWVRASGLWSVLLY